ncbi:TPA: ferrous iron transport protein A [Candidatus Ventrenecus stercoripullorum]|nr:ferrous iron transport protein A [Candidatus Ventrenecus stercoripullorum]
MLKRCSDLKILEKGIIQEVSLDEKKKFKLFHLGVLPGKEICCKFRSPFASPIAYQVDGCVFALRKEDAKKIEVDV